MTATMTKTKPITGEWSSIFPNEQITEQQSALFVKKLLAVAVSNITYLRAIFPEHAFGDRCIEDLNLKILKDDSSCPGSCQVIKWVKGCFDALEKKYLRMVVIGIYVDEDTPDTVIESYTFKFSYRDSCGIDIYRNDKKISSAYNAEETKKATIRLLRTVIVLTQTLKSLPDDVMMTMKLLYYDDVTPTDYEPPGFKSSLSDAFVFEEEPANISVGDVNTPFHTVKIRIKTGKSQFDMDEADEGQAVVQDEAVMERQVCDGLDEEEVSPRIHAIQDNNGREMSGAHEFKEDNQRLPQSCPQTAGDVPVESPAVPSTNGKAVMSQQSNVGEVSEEYEVKCPCGCNEDDGLMVLCDICKLWQHAICFSIFSEHAAPASHICHQCVQVTNCPDKATDPYLNDLSPLSAQALCLWRRALHVCLETKAILAPTFARRLGVEITVAQGLINRLSKEGYVRPSNRGKKHGKLVNLEKVKNHAFPKYFKMRSDDAERDKAGDVNKENAIPDVGCDNELEKLTKKAGEMEIVKRGKRGRGQAKNADTITTGDVTPQSSRRGKKRAISKVDESCEFDVSNGQDVDGEGDRRRAKKSSVAAHSIMV